MALISSNNLTTGHSGSNPATTASITPTAGKFYTVEIDSRLNPNTTVNDPTVSGCGLTFTKAKVSTKVINSTSITTWIFYAVGTPSTGTISIDFGSQADFSDVSWSVDEWTNVDMTGVNGANGIVQSVANTSGNSGSFNVTLAALSSSNNVNLAIMIQGNVFSTLTAGSGQNVIENTTWNEGSVLIQWKLNVTVSDVTSNDSSHGWSGVAVELKFAEPANGAFLYGLMS